MVGGLRFLGSGQQKQQRVARNTSLALQTTVKWSQNSTKPRKVATKFRRTQSRITYLANVTAITFATNLAA